MSIKKVRGYTMILRETKKLYKAAVKKWGLPLQMGMLMEECAELIQATSKVIRKGDREMNTWRNLAEEMADVEIMIEQLKQQITWADMKTMTATYKHDKLLRLKTMLEAKE